MNNENLETLRRELIKELQKVEDSIYTFKYNRLSEWDKGYLQGKELGLRLAIQKISYLL